MSKIKRISNLLGKSINIMLFVFVTILVIITFFQVLARFVFKIPIVWTEEIVRLCFVWIIFLGGAIGIKEKTHLTLDMLVESFNERWKHIMRLLVLSLILIAVVIMFVGGYRYFIQNIGKTAITMPIPSNVVYIAAPISALLMIFFIIEQFMIELNLNTMKGE